MSERDAAVRVCLVGYGYAGKTFHAPLIAAVPGLRLAVVGSSRREAVQAAYPGVIVCDAMEAATHAEVDLAVIATPNESHFSLAAAALRAGKHVVVDKPFTVTLTEARALAEIARRQGRILSVFHNRRWESEIRGAKEILESGVLGAVSHYECHMDRFRPVVRRRWREDPGPGAGLWFDLGPHLIDQALYLFGLPDSVSASFATLREGGLTDDWAQVQLNYKRLRVVLHASLLVSGGGPRSVLHGTRGSWAKFGADVQERQLQSGMLPGDPAFGYDASPGVVYDGASGTEREVPSPRGDQRGFYAAMRDAVRGEGAAPVPVRDAVAVMAVLEASFASGAQGRVLEIALTAEERGEWD